MTDGIGFVGYPGSGKTTAAVRLSARPGWGYVSTGDAVRRRARRELGADADPARVAEWIGDRIAAEGPQLVSDWTLDWMDREHTADRAAVDSVRTPRDYEAFSAAFDRFELVYVTADRETRLARLCRRDRNGEAEYDLAHLRERDETEDDYGVADVLAAETYDRRLANEDGIGAFCRRVAQLGARVEREGWSDA
ncbi:MAG: AAA family ATPase [Halobaculum sp.]